MTKLLTRKAAVAKGALMAFLAPKLALDAKIDLTPILDGVTGKNFPERKTGIATALKAATKGKLAQDADIEDVTKLLDALEQVEEQEAAVDTAPLSTAPNGAVSWAELKDKLKDRVSQDEMAALDALCAGKAMDAEESEEDKKKREDKEKAGAAEKTAKDEEMKNMVTKPAMDAAITAAVNKARSDERAIRDAERAVRPYVGELAPAKGKLAFDSAEDVYRTTLGMLDVSVDSIDTVPLPALKAILAAQALPGSKQASPRIALDAAGAKSFADRHPEAARISTIG